MADLTDDIGDYGDLPRIASLLTLHADCRRPRWIEWYVVLLIVSVLLMSVLVPAEAACRQTRDGQRCDAVLTAVEAAGDRT